MAGNNQTFTLTFDAKLNVNQMRSSINNIQGALNKLNLPSNLSKGFNDTFTKLSNEIRNFESLTGKEISTKADFGKLEKSTNTILNLFDKLKSDIGNLNGLSNSQVQKLFPDSIKNNIKEASKALEEYNNKNKKAIDDYATAQKSIQKYQDAITKEQNKTIVSPDTFKQFKQEADAASAEVGRISEQLYALTEQAAAKAATLTKPMSSSTYRGMIKEIEELKGKLDTAKATAEDTRNKLKGITTESIQAKNIEGFNQKLAEATQKAAQLKQELNSVQGTNSGQGLGDLISKIGQLTGLDMSKFSNDAKGAGEAIQTYLNNAIQTFINNASSVTSITEREGSAFDNLRGNIQDAGASFEQFNHQAQEIEQIKSRIQYFFGLNNAINLFKRTVQSAIATVKELDATMTETAVVTDFTVSDMWDQLPEYTKRANELGVSTQQAYEAATLYYQQGLNTNQVIAVSNETLKMARIAGLEAAEATDRMTNALRGFNMEINEASAQRINDIYSELAARTASDVDEISTAMTKVASLAHGANMEFETTSALLTQIIETTREAPETAGTALKTIIARFTEVKSLYDEGQLFGTDEEGTNIDLNKISSALRIAGIDLNKYFTDQVGLDDIFLELASKWDSLTTIQQRYIATQAAGSRQQSRFIAMMQDYARTTDLVSMAYNANGASAKQFEKTQESLQSKLARLRNAWNEFTMSIANSDLIKAAVDALTGFLNIINQITSGFGAFKDGAGTVVNAILKIGMAAAALKVGGLFLGTGAGVLGGIASGKPISLNQAFANAAYSSLGTRAATVAAEGGSAALSQNVGRTIGMAAMSPFGWMAPLSGKIKSFKQSAINPNWEASLNAEEYFRYLQGDLQPLSPKTLFGAVGNKFLGTKIGTKIAGAFGFEGAAAGAATLGTAIAGVAAAAGAAVLVVKGLYELSPAGQVKRAEKWKEQIDSVKDSLEEQAKTAKTAQESYLASQNKINEATNPKARQEAITAANEEVLAMVEANSELARFLEKDNEGRLTLTKDFGKESYENYVDGLESAAKSAQISSLFAEAAIAGQKADLYRGKGTPTKDTGTWVSEEEYNSPELQRYRNQADAYAQQAAALYSTAIAESLRNNEVDNNIANIVGDALATNYDADKYKDQIKQARKHLNLNLKDDYEAIYGIGSSEGLSRRAMKTAIAESEYTANQTNNAEQLASLASSDKNFANILSMIGGIYEGDLEDLAYKFTESEIEALKEFFEIDEEGNDGLVKALNEAQKKNNEIINKRRTKAFTTLFQNDSFIEDGIIEQIRDNLSTSQIEMLAAISDSVSEYGTNFTQGIISNMYSLMDEANNGDQVAQAAVDYFSNIDWNDPIEAYDRINAAASSTNPKIRETGELLLQVGSSQFSDSYLVQSYLLSSEYEDLNEQLNSFIEQNGKISSKNIKDLAASNSKLNKLLKDGVISAKALAITLTGIQTGKLAFENLTSSILAAADAMNDLDGFTSDVIDELNSFDPGFDENDITGFVNKAFENASENIEKGAFGNNQMKNYMEHIFGPFQYDENMGDYGAAYKNWLIQNTSWLEANKDNMFSAWSDFASGLDGKLKGVADIYEQDGEIILNANGMTTEQLVQAMVDTGKVTKTQAEMMIGDYKNYSADFAHEMAQNDLPKIISKWSENLTSINGKKIYNSSEIDALEALTGYSKEEIEQAIQTLDGLNAKKVELTSDMSLSEKIGNLSEAVGGFRYGREGNSLFDADKLKESLSAIGLSDQFEAALDECLEAGDTFTTEINGKLQEITIGANETAAQAYNRVLTEQEQAQQDAYQQRFGQNFMKGASEITLEVQNENALTAVQEVTTAVENIPEKIDLDLNINNIEKIDTLTEVVNNPVELPVNPIPSKTPEEVKGPYQELVGNLSVSADSNPAPSSIESNYSGLQGDLTVHVTYVEDNARPARHGKVGAIAKSEIPGFADGKIGNNKPSRNYEGVAFTGEEGIEARIDKNGNIDLLGTDGPEFTYVNKDDTILTHVETKKLFGNESTSRIPGFARGYGSIEVNKGGRGSGGDGGGSDDKPDEWKNDLDWLYNLMEDIAELERIQTDLEEEYEDLLKDQNATGKDLYKLLIKQLGNLYTQLDHQTFALTKREQEMREFMDVTNDMDQYLWWNAEDRTLEIDWDAIDQITDKDTYEHVKDLIDEAEDIQDKMDDAEDAIQDIENQIQELENIWRDTFIDFEQRVYDAIVGEYQDVINKYSELNDTLNNSNQAILESLQKQISLERQIRDNTETEEDIAESEAQLAYLRRDTTGGNTLAAMELQEQLEDSRRDYEDTLVDQAIERLSQDNDLAAEQRDHQIEIMQAQLDYAQENGEYWNMVSQMIAEATGDDGELLTNTRLEQLLQSQESWDAMSDTSKQVWEEELQGTFKEVVAYLLKEDAELNGTFYTALTAAVDGVGAAIGSYSQAMVKLGNSISSLGGPAGGGGSSGGGSSKSSRYDQSDFSRNGNIVVNLKTPSGMRYDLTNKYATGGLNTKTGLAWLDGTPSEPEYVLNARQTEAFLKLTDILPTLMSNDLITSNNNQSINLNLVMNVDQIASDYDVDRIANRVKDIVYNASTYRNVNTLNFQR